MRYPSKHNFASKDPSENDFKRLIMSLWKFSDWSFCIFDAFQKYRQLVSDAIYFVEGASVPIPHT